MLKDEGSKLVLTLIAAITISIFINIILLIDLVDPYLHETNRVVNIFEFYNQMQGDHEDAILFLGSSQIAGDLDTNIVEESLKPQNLSAHIFNLGYSADTPLRRITELDQLLKARPDMVIVGLTYYGLNNESFPISPDSLALVSNSIKLDPYSRSLE